ncbi:glycosyltransferase family 2 protein [Atractiella rhizophila]|nr:glycosyltransferase family 2 protein [Atractiella rhizophila]
MLYLLASAHPAIFIPLGVIGLFRYLWFFIRLLAACSYSPIAPPPPGCETYRAEEDVTIVVPTIDADPIAFPTAARTWLECNPKEVIIVTVEKTKADLEALAASINFASKRLQMCLGVLSTTTDIVVFSDDDALWPSPMLRYILACFEDQSIGGVGTSQVVTPSSLDDQKWTVWEVLAAFRLSIRNTEVMSSCHIDGGTPCLSGRTAAYRTCILKDPAFLRAFTQDFWRGKYHLNSGDDKFLTRWLVSHDWNVYIQSHPDCTLKSTMKPSWRFLLQVLRWTRNTWRSDLRSLFKERKILVRYPYVSFTMVDKLFNPLTLLAGPLFVIAYATRGEMAGWKVGLCYIAWLHATRAIKLAPHLFKRPKDIIYLPAWLIFGYYFAIMKIYALFTLHEVGWGTRAGVGGDEDLNIRTAEELINMGRNQRLPNVEEWFCGSQEYSRPHPSLHPQPPLRNQLHAVNFQEQRMTGDEKPLIPMRVVNVASSISKDYCVEKDLPLPPSEPLNYSKPTADLQEAIDPFPLADPMVPTSRSQTPSHQVPAVRLHEFSSTEYRTAVPTTTTIHSSCNVSSFPITSSAHTAGSTIVSAPPASIFSQVSTKRSVTTVASTTRHSCGWATDTDGDSAKENENVQAGCS